MRKWLSLFLAALLTLCCTTALAERGSLSGAAQSKQTTQTTGQTSEEPTLPEGGSTDVSGGIDLTTLSDAELQSLIDAARRELASRSGGSTASEICSNGSVLFEDENIRITMSGDLELSEYDELILPIVIENLTDRNLIISLEHSSCNGWEISSPVASVSASKKARDTFEFYDIVEDAGLTSVEDVQEIEGSIRYFDEDDYDFTVENESTVVWRFQ